MKDSLFEQFEDINTLRDAVLLSTGRVKSAYSKKITKLTKQEDIIEDIILSLDKQRVHRDEQINGGNLRSMNPVEQMAEIAGLRHTKANFAQRAFSLPADYRIKSEDSKENDFIEDIVIQPEFIPDEFLVRLGIITEGTLLTMTIEEKIRKKIESIKIVKQFLKDASVLQLGQKKSTGRICINLNPGSQFFGKYLLFQETTDIETEGRKKRKMVRKVVPKIYDDIYTIMRSQNYATSGLQSKIDFLSHMRDLVLPSLFEKWKDTAYSGEDKKNDIATLVSTLRRKLSYNEKRALEDRINKIQFANLEQDKLRIIGAYNDIIKELEEKIGKLKELDFQLRWLIQSERQWRIACDRLVKNLLLELNKTTPIFDSLNAGEIDASTHLSGEQAHGIVKIWKILREFSVLIRSFPHIGAPYHKFPVTLEKYLQEFESMRTDKKSPMGLDELRITLGAILAIKRLRFESVYAESSHRIKAGDIQGKNRLEELLSFLEDIKFLPQIALTEKGNTDFSQMAGKIRELLN